MVLLLPCVPWQVDCWIFSFRPSPSGPSASASDHGVVLTFVVMSQPIFAKFQPFCPTSPFFWLDSLTFPLTLTFLALFTLPTLIIRLFQSSNPFISCFRLPSRVSNYIVVIVTLSFSSKHSLCASNLLWKIILHIWQRNHMTATITNQNLEVVFSRHVCRLTLDFKN